MTDPVPAAPAPHRAPSIIDRIVASTLQLRLLVIVLTVILIGVGVRSLQRLPVDAYPDLSPPMVEIVTQWPGHAAEEVERQLTVPVELGMNGIPKTAIVRSVSLYGLSDVVINFCDGADREAARQQEIFF